MTPRGRAAEARHKDEDAGSTGDGQQPWASLGAVQGKRPWTGHRAMSYQGAWPEDGLCPPPHSTQSGSEGHGRRSPGATRLVEMRQGGLCKTEAVAVGEREASEGSREPLQGHVQFITFQRTCMDRHKRKFFAG